MKTRQANALDMYRTLHKFLLTTARLEARTVPALQQVTADFVAELAQLEALVQRQAQPLAPGYRQREALTQELAHTTVAIGGAALSYATERSDRQLAALVRVRLSDFVRIRTTRRPSLARRVFEAVRPLASQLVSYGVTAADLAGFEAQIVAVEKSLSVPRLTAIAKIGATQELPHAFRRLRDLVKLRLDPLTFPWRRKNPQLYARYKSTCQIVCHGGRRKARRHATGARLPLASAAHSPFLRREIKETSSRIQRRPSFPH